MFETLPNQLKFFFSFNGKYIDVVSLCTFQAGASNKTSARVHLSSPGNYFRSPRSRPPKMRSLDESKMRKNNLDSEASLQYHKILNVFGTCVRLDRPIIAATTYGLLPAIYSTTQVSLGLLTLATYLIDPKSRAAPSLI